MSYGKALPRSLGHLIGAACFDDHLSMVGPPFLNGTVTIFPEWKDFKTAVFFHLLREWYNVQKSVKGEVDS